VNPTLLIIFLSSADRDGTVGEALSRAVQDALGPQVEIALRADPGLTDDAALERERRLAGARAAARVAWLDDLHLQAEVAFCGQPPVQRQTIRFAASDPLAERGRALGVVIAYRLVTAPPDATPAETAPAPVARAPAADLPEPRRWSLEAFAAVAVPVGGDGAGFGGGLGLRWRGEERWGARVGARLRGAEIGAAQASYSGWAFAAGVTRRIGPPPAGWVPGLSLRAEGLLLYEALTHYSSDDPAPVRRGRLLPAVSALLEATFRLTGNAALYLNAGAEVATGPTEILVRRSKVAELAPWRAVAEAGFRTHL
jgi:hypothetical protein